MTVGEFLGGLRALDVQIVLDGERLRVNAPAGVLSETHRSELAQRKGEIVEFLRAARQLSNQQRAIVPLEGGGSRVPIFAVAGHNGDVFCYRALVQHLGHDQPFYGLQPPGIDEGSTPLATVASLAGYFAEQIRSMHRGGPLVVAGFCAGGTIAFELARQLSESGIAVNSLMLFGAPYALVYRPFMQRLGRGVDVIRRSFVHARALLTLRGAERRRYVAERIRRRPEPPAENDPVLVRRRRVEDTTVAAIRSYQPRPVPLHIDLMLPCRSWARTLDMPQCWARLGAGSEKFFGPEGCGGDTMLLPEYAPIFAKMVDTVQTRGADQQ